MCCYYRSSYVGIIKGTSPLLFNVRCPIVLLKEWNEVCGFCFSIYLSLCIFICLLPDVNDLVHFVCS
jgi:hypothetical protein